MRSSASRSRSLPPHPSGAKLDAAGMVSELALRTASEDDLRALGLSRPKARYLRGIAEAGLDWEGLRALPDDEVIAQLVALPGIGRLDGRNLPEIRAWPGRCLRGGRSGAAGGGAAALWAGGAPLGQGPARDGRAVAPVACGCGAGALGLLPHRQRPRGSDMTDRPEIRAPGARTGRQRRHLPARLRRRRGRPSGPRRAAGPASARHRLLRAERARALPQQPDGVPVVSDPLAGRLVRGGCALVDDALDRAAG